MICWKLNLYERICVLFTGRLYQYSIIEGQELQGSLMTIGKPLEDVTDKMKGNPKVTSEIQE